MAQGSLLVAVTGASGLIGTALRRSLEADGHQVRPVVRRPVRPGESAVAWDPDAGTIDRDGLEGIDAVVHLAGAGIGDRRWSTARKRVILESRTRGTALLAGALAGLDAKPAVLVSGSAIGYYGERGDDVVTEETGPGHDFLASVCKPWESEARPVAEAGIRLATIRTGIVLTPEGGALPRMLPMFRFGLGGPYGTGRQWWSWISLADEIGAIRHLIDHDVHGPVNLTAPEPVRQRELAKALGRVLKRPAVLPVPAFGPKLVVGAELAQALLFTSAKVVPTVLEGAGYRFAHPDVETALRAVLDRPA
jgi:uncharacterized protein (TIGR01777 family)